MATNRFEPLYDTVIVERVESTSQTPGGIFIPDSGKDKPQEAVVIAVGPGRMLPEGKRAPMETKVGDVVTFPPTAGMDTDFGVGRAIRMMRDPDVDTVEEA